MDFWNNLDTISAAILGFCAVMYGAYRLMLKIRAKIIVNHEQKKLEQATRAETRKIVDEIYKQLKPNGGSSLRDAIDSIDSRLYRVERQQLVQHQVQQLIMLDSGLAVFDADEHGDWVRVNRTFQTMVGRTEEELRGKGWVVAVAEEDRADVFEEWYQAVAQNREFFMTFNLMGNDGLRIPASCKGFPMRDMEGNLAGFTGFLRKAEVTDGSNRTTHH